MSPIRVALIWPTEPWLGGVNYFRNLCHAIKSKHSAKIELILFTGLHVNTHDMDEYTTIVRLSIFDKRAVPWWLWKIGTKLNYDLFLFRILKSHRIDVVSHHPPLWSNCPIPSLPWIPDFQHLHLPHFFTEHEISVRNKAYARICRQQNRVLLSSQDAEADLKAFFGASLPHLQSYVLRFVSCLMDNISNIPEKQLLMRHHRLHSPWFYVPNQFWAHKNHQIIIEALCHLKQKGQEILIVATGKSDDFRNPDYYPKLMNQVKAHHLEDNFRHLGVLPYYDILGLMRHSIAVVNPSLFEGWSTTVEEAKSLGKKIILSDIPVHREQLPERALYFDPADKIALAESLMSAAMEYDEQVENRYFLNAQQSLPGRAKAFAEEYENIIFSICHGNQS